MRRGSTPELRFELPFAGSEVEKLSVAFEQRGKVVLEKTLADCEVQGCEVSVQLSEDDTLAFLPDEPVARVQVRCGVGDRRMASDILSVPVRQILRGGKL